VIHVLATIDSLEKLPGHYSCFLLNRIVTKHIANLPRCRPAASWQPWQEHGTTSVAIGVPFIENKR